MTQRLSRRALSQILQAEDIETLSTDELTTLIREEITDHVPDGSFRVDPRNGDRVLYHSSRGTRPHDNVPAEASTVPERECVICQGQTTGVVDVAELSEGFTFINKNLFPILYPFEDPERIQGMHFLQWTSSCHDRDWHNMAQRDRVVVMERLAALERTLLEGASHLSSPQQDGDRGQDAFVVIIKNYGHLVGGSLAHGHQQIALSSVLPRHFADNTRFLHDHGETFSSAMLRVTPAELVVRDYGPAMLVVPGFMRRPYDMMLLVKDVTKAHLYELDVAELEAVAQAWHDAIRAIRDVMPRIGREIAYNVIANNGPGAGLYFEFLPYTQETGGVEHLGLLSCQELPERAAADLRKVVAEGG